MNFDDPYRQLSGARQAAARLADEQCEPVPTVSSVLSSAADILTAMKWCQLCAAQDEHGTPVSATNQQAVAVCGVGAIERAIELAQPALGDVRSNLMDKAVRTAQRLVRHRTQAVHLTVSSWNDSPARTKADVVELLRDAAETVRKDDA